MSRTGPDFIPPARPVVGEDEIEAAVRVLRSGMVVQGPEVAGFEDEFSAQVGGRHCVAVNSGTSALQLSLMAIGLRPGDEVIVPSFSFAASANAVRLAGGVPVFVDIEPEHFTLDPDAVAAAVGPRTAAIMPVHLYGHPADMTALQDIAVRHGLAVVEDAAQAHGATWADRPVGAWGTAGCFSFYPTKNMHSLEGGMVTTDDAELARTVRLLRNQGMEQRYANEVVGANMRLTDVAAAVGRAQLKKLDGWNEQRRKNAAHLSAGLTHVGTPATAAEATHVFHQYTIRVREGRDRVQAGLTERGIGSAVYYPTPIHLLKPYLPGRARRQPRLGPARDDAGRRRGAVPAGVPGAVRGRAVPDRRGRQRAHGRVSAVGDGTLRAGLIGLGAMGRHHARVLAGLEGVELVAVADPGGDPHARAQGVEVLADVAELIGRGLDYAVVACPTGMHEEVGLQLAEAGVCALIEKPLAESLPAAHRLVEAFESRGLVAGVGHIERYNPALQSLRRRLEAGELGEVYQVVTRRQGPFPHRIADVGVVKDLATHDIDLTAWVTGQEYAAVAAQTFHKSGRPHEDGVAVTARLSGDVVVSHLVNWLSPFKERFTAVTGAAGSFVADTLTGDLTFHANGAQDMGWEALAAFRGVSEGDSIRFALSKREPLQVEHERFRDAVAGGDAGIVTLREGLRTVQVADAVLESASTGCTVEVPPTGG